MAYQRRYSRPGGRARGHRSPTSWVGAEFDINALAANSKLILGGFTPVQNLPHETVTRIVGSYNFRMSGGDRGTIAIGAVIVTDTAFAVGVTAMPDPVTDVSDDNWLFIRSASQNGAVLNSFGDFDGRGQRKLDEGTTLAIIAVNSCPVNNVSGSVFMRVLTKHVTRT